MRGFFGIGIQNGKVEMNIGTLWRSANLFGASFIYTIGKRYQKQASDTMKTFRNVPLYHYDTFSDFYKALPHGARLVGVELHNESIAVSQYSHPQQCVYLLGAEDHGLTNEAIEACHSIIQLPGDYSMNVAVAGSIVMFDRYSKSIAKSTNPNLLKLQTV